MKSIASKLNVLTIFLITLTTLATGGYLIWRQQVNVRSDFDILLVVLVIILAGIVLALWQTRRILLPIKQLTAATQAVSRGDFSNPLPYSSEDEFAEIAAAINDMSQELARYRHDAANQRETLEEQVAQRTSELEHKTDEAYQLVDEAQAASRAKSEFLATISHEIITPINGVMGMTELLINTELSSRQKHLAETIFRAVESLRSVISNITDLSQIENGKAQLSIDDFDLRALLDDTAQIIPSQPQIAAALVKDESPESKGTILIAEDQPINQEVGKYMLGALGYQVDCANNGLEAVNATAKKHYDLILMDCHMPEMDGFTATETIRKRELAEFWQRRIPIIALTADAQTGIVEQCLDAGMDGYLGKPFNSNQLQEVVSKWLLDKRHQTGPEVTTNAADVYQQGQPPNITERRSIVLKAEALENLRQITTTAGETLLNNAIRMFLHSAPEAVQALRNAFAIQDTAVLRKTAHSFKSVCANLGAQALADACASIESIAKQGKLTGVAELLLSMEVNLPKVINALTKEFDSAALDNPPPPKRQDQPKLASKRILLVDDDSNFRLITSVALNASGFLVDEAVSGSQALEKIARQVPDLVLLDAVMDGLDGFETCRLLRNAQNMADVPIIMATGLEDIDSINRAFDAGANDFVIKPLNYPILAHRLGFILRASHNIAELRSKKFQLSAAQRIARLGYWTWDVTLNQFQISEHLAELCGIDLSSFNKTLEGFIALIHPDDQGFVKNVITAARNKATIQHTEYRLQVSHSEPIIVHQEIEAITENQHSIITGTVQDITHKKQTELQIHRLAYFDNLTGLASRAYYHERIDDFINTANRRNEQFAFLFLDLDGFKDINDSFGHDVGDHFLQAIAERLKDVVRDIDFAARLGGDEFCIILNNIADNEGIAEVADRCLRQVNQPLQLDQYQLKPRVSIGIAIYPKDGTNEIDLMKAADAAMYAAKQAGKQRYMFYSDDMASQAITRLEKEQTLREAFDQDQFVLHYQPQISMQTGKMIGMEALIRWQHPEKGLIPPLEFIPLADQLGLITELGNWVLHTACRQIVQWHQAGLPYLRVSVNIAPAHFQNPELFNTVEDLLQQTGIPPECLELEITESAIQTVGSLNVFKQLRDIGVKIAIDDFGTGYSCLASLKQLPLDCLKIDKVFVDDVLSNPHTALLLGTIIGLANALDYTLVAEGVETKEQALIMHGLGCHIIQGYLFSRPVASDQIPALFNVDFTLPKNNA
ncbi:MAG: EAL domain-containing protein [Methylococcaceae bacterium]|nr:EAL domain-containing protein [Methylococcaceae bacterium]